MKTTGEKNGKLQVEPIESSNQNVSINQIIAGKSKENRSSIDECDNKPIDQQIQNGNEVKTGSVNERHQENTISKECVLAKLPNITFPTSKGINRGNRRGCAMNSCIIRCCFRNGNKTYVSFLGSNSACRYPSLGLKIEDMRIAMSNYTLEKLTSFTQRSSLFRKVECRRPRLFRKRRLSAHPPKQYAAGLLRKIAQLF